MALVKFDEGGGIRVHLSRLFESEEAARKYLSIRDIVCNKKYRKADGELTPEQFDRQVKQVLDIVKRNEVCNV